MAVPLKYTNMSKIRTVAILLICILGLHVVLPISPAEAYAALTAPSAILFEPNSEKIIFARAPHRKQAPASTTKLVTALVVLDMLSLDDWVTVSSRVEHVEPSKLFLRGGDRLRVRDLLKAVLMNSANDAASALAISVSGSERAFADLMTRKARSLRARNTRFVNASGLPARGQYSTAYDLALIMREATKNDVIVSILKQKKAFIQTYTGKPFHLRSHNKMLWRHGRVIGKTGWTRGAKYCFVGSIQEGRPGTIVVVLGSRKLWIDLSTLVNQAVGVSRGSSGKNLSIYAKGEDVEELQLGLKRAGFFKGRATGYFGKKTRKAVLRFQHSHGLSVDGIVGVQTRRALAPYL